MTDATHAEPHYRWKPGEGIEFHTGHAGDCPPATVDPNSSEALENWAAIAPALDALTAAKRDEIHEQRLATQQEPTISFYRTEPMLDSTSWAPLKPGTRIALTDRSGARTIYVAGEPVYHDDGLKITQPFIAEGPTEVEIVE